MNKQVKYFAEMMKYYYEKQMGLYEKIIELLQDENIEYRFVHDDTTPPAILMNEEDFFGDSMTLILSANDRTFELHMNQYVEGKDDYETIKVAESNNTKLIVNCIKGMKVAHHLGMEVTVK